MKILFNPLMPTGIKNPDFVSDYQSDMVFHGLVKTLGLDLHTNFYMWWHHSKEKKQEPEIFKRIWGKGFTMYGLLEPNEYTRKQQVGIYDYDAVVIPIHHSMNRKDDELMRLINFVKHCGYEKKQIIVVDGWDRPYINKDIANLCTYYKRELIEEHQNYAKPISFAFPKEKIPEIDDTKREKAFAPLIPVNQSIDPSYMSTYIYEEEQEYYDMYKTCYFAYTSKKGGWDTLRHYEIIANGSIPFFVDLENCPDKTLWNMPKDLLIRAKKELGGIPNLKEAKWENQVLDHCGCIDIENPGSLKNFDLKLWEAFRTTFYSWLKNKNSTESLAEYILGGI